MVNFNYKTLYHFLPQICKREFLTTDDKIKFNVTRKVEGNLWFGESGAAGNR